jgi:hypothetical protein
MEKEIGALFDRYIPDGMKIDQFRAAGGDLRPLMWKFFEAWPDSEFYNKEFFINGLTERMEKFPEGKFTIPFVVSIAMLYKHTHHQDLTMKCADECLKAGNGNFAMASVFSMYLEKVANDAANAKVPEKGIQKMLEKILGIMGVFGNNSFAPLRMICEVSQFAESLRPSRGEASNPRIDISALPLPDKEPFLSFLLAFENVCTVYRQDPAAINEFCYSFFDLSKGKTQLFMSSVSVLAWSARLEPRENSRVAGEVLTALRSWDLSYLKLLEEGLKRSMDISP